MRIWVDGRVLESPEEPVLSALDHGFVVGDGVFETLLALDGRPFALTRHLDRLAKSALGLGLDAPDLDRVREGVDAVLAGTTPSYGRVRVTMSSGPGPLGSPRGDAPYTYVVAAHEIAPISGTAAVATVPWPRNERGALSGVKSTSYAENALMVEHAIARGATEAIMPNTRGNVCEGTGSNIFYEHNGRLMTPTLASGCLAGITRALVLEWCGGQIEVVEEDGPIERLAETTEAFITSSARNVMGLHRIDDRELPAPGPLTAAAAAMFEARMRDDLDP